MTKSRQTFSKKEKEQKRLKKRQDKEKKKEERKADAVKGQSIDDMIAYVDEFGNITSTPPDPTKKKVIKAEDIPLGVPAVDEEPEELIRTGSVTFFNTSKGYGFIKDLKSQESIFVHMNDLLTPVKERDKVTFEVEMGKKGPNAVRVKVES